MMLCSSTKYSPLPPYKTLVYVRSLGPKFEVFAGLNEIHTSSRPPIPLLPSCSLSVSEARGRDITAGPLSLRGVNLCVTESSEA